MAKTGRVAKSTPVFAPAEAELQTPDTLIDAYLAEKEPSRGVLKFSATPSGRAMLAMGPTIRATIVARASDRYRTIRYSPLGTADKRLRQIISDVIRAKASDVNAFATEHLVPVIEAAARFKRDHRQFEYFPKKAVVGALEKLVDNGAVLTPILRAALETWREAAAPRSLTAKEEVDLARATAIALDDATSWSQSRPAFERIEHLKRVTTPLKAERELLERLDALLGKRGSTNTAAGADGSTEPIVPPTDAVGAAVARDRAPKAAATGRAWSALLNHARALSATTPTQKWLANAASLAADVPAKAFADRLADWFAQAGQPAAEDRAGAYGHAINRTLLNDASADLLKGLCWTAAAAGRADLAPALGLLAEKCFGKVRDHGPRNVRVANAAVAALAAFGKPEAAAPFASLRTRVKHPSSRTTIERALNALSTKTGLSVDELSEIGVPTFDVELEQALADRSILSKQAARMLAAQSIRIERLFMTPSRTWPYPAWRERYLDHPLIGLIARRLIWLIDEAPAMWLAGKLIDVNDRPVKTDDKSIVHLWHPTMSSAPDVLAWRQFLQRHQVTQPFKQAHREVYLLTDAEWKTRTYSNRFAAHVLRQHQFAALAAQRGWSYRLQGTFDSCSVPTLELPQHNLTATFRVEPIEHGVSGPGIYLYVTSDQVSFGAPLARVPAIVFSEVMRDVDLFVGVASVGNDPNWQPGDALGAHRDYWQQFSFGPLNESAATRRQVLEALLPRLKIADRCTLSDRFLVVRGDLRTYKIHLGSGNILMEPNDEYLCIVPGSGGGKRTTATILLPFEGDATLSIILSKAFLLAADTKIPDASILGQIKRKFD